MSRYRDSEEPYKNRTLRGYRDMGSDRYLASRAYPRPYRNPRPARTYSRPTAGRGGRGRLDRNSKPEYFQSPKPEKKYEAVLKPEKMSSPQVERAPRYTLGSRGPEVWTDTEDITKEVERRVEGRLTEQLLEKFGTELKELMQKVEKASENSGSSAEGRTEPRQEVERVERHVEREQEQGGDVETERLESDGGSPEVTEESKEDDVSLEGGFIFSRPFGLAVPIETGEAKSEQATEEQAKGETAEKRSGIEPHENESVEPEVQDEAEDSEEKSEIEKENEDEHAENEKQEIAETESSGTIEAEDKSNEEIDSEALEEIAAEGLVEIGETGEASPKGMIESEVVPELLPEETELYPAEEEPVETV